MAHTDIVRTGWVARLPAGWVAYALLARADRPVGGWLLFLPGLWAIAGPLFLTFTLTKWSGIGITEKAIHGTRPGYADYVRRTSAFIPWPPKKV
jgi:steroid 5-alpha reductase family enzyme